MPDPTLVTGSGDDGALAAGEFERWISEIRAALRGERAADVACNGCTACCTSSQFVHVAPDEVDALAHIPRELLFPAPGLPAGHVVLGYDERGHCPMLLDGACSIYAHRPRTCRTYDCRVFPAAGLVLEDVEKTEIGRRARRWRFSTSTDESVRLHEAVRAAASFVRDHPEVLPGGTVTTTRIAVLAVELHDLFLDGAAPDVDEVRRRAQAGDAVSPRR